MTKISQLHQFILNLNLFAAEQMDSFIDDLTVTPACRPTSIAGELLIAEKDYTATFFIERYPHGLVSADQLIAHICTWLIENDPNRLKPVIFDIVVDVLDSATANLEFRVVFYEQILATETPGGSLQYQNGGYVLR